MAPNWPAEWSKQGKSYPDIKNYVTKVYKIDVLSFEKSKITQAKDAKDSTVSSNSDESDFFSLTLP